MKIQKQTVEYRADGRIRARLYFNGDEKKPKVHFHIYNENKERVTFYLHPSFQNCSVLEALNSIMNSALAVRDFNDFDDWATTARLDYPNMSESELLSEWNSFQRTADSLTRIGYDDNELIALWEWFENQKKKNIRKKP